MRTLYILLLSVASLLATQAQVYYLPKTVLRFHLLIERQTYTPGHFAHYAKRYLQIDNVQEQPQVNHRVVRCELSTFGLRDNDKCYTLRLKGKGEAADVRVSDDGVLLAINSEPLPTPTSPYALLLQSQRTHQTDTDPRTLLSAETLSAGSTAKMAELTALQITELRHRRQLLATGEADEMPQDERQLQLMLTEIDRQCNTLMRLFTGTTQRDTIEQTSVVCPDREVQHEVVFRLSRTLGLVDKDDLSGVPFYMTLRCLTPTPAPVAEGKQTQKKDEGLYVNVPATVQLSLQQDDQPLAAFNIPMAQFGYVRQRDTDVFKRFVTHLTLHPETGSVATLFADTDK